MAAAGLGACLGFLWWNTSPARIFMGDTGSLALGGLLSGLAIVTRTELLLVVLGGLFVAVTLSVVIQVAFFRATRRRVFRMAPLHHHFELAGWTENTVIVRFWLVTGDGRRLRHRVVLRRLARLRRAVSVRLRRTVLVAGLGVSGAAAARVLLRLGARVLLTDAAEPPVVAELVTAGASWLGRLDAVPDGTDLVVTSPGLAPRRPAAGRRRRAAASRWSASRSWPGGCACRARTATPAPWLAVTGTNGKTTTVTMLEAILLAAGRRAVAAGNVGRPLVEVVTAVEDDGTPTYDVVAVELSSFQLHWSSSLAPAAAAVLNVADDHTDWHGSFAAYRDAKARILRLAPVAVADAGDPVAAALVAGHPRPVTVTLGEPAPGQLGVRSGALVDRAFGADPAGEVLLDLADLQVPGPHNRVNALAAAALARADRRPGRGGRPRPGRLPRRRAPQRPGRHRRRRRLRRRQQGDQPARRRRVAGRLPPGRLDRRRPAQGRRRRSAGRGGRRAARRGGPPGPRPGADRRLAGATRPDGPRGHGGQRRR